MKVTFWKNKNELFFGWLLSEIILTFLIIIFLILIITDKTYGFVAIGFILLFLINLYILFAQRSLLSKICFSKTCISWIWLKKEIQSINWEEITNIKVKNYGKTRYLEFVAGDKSIDIDIDRKIYETIMVLCPYESQKSQINNLAAFKYLHK